MKKLTDIKFKVEYVPWEDIYNVYGAIINPINNGFKTVDVIKPLECDRYTLENGEILADKADLNPMLKTKRSDLQALMDGLWNAGIRPTDYKDQSAADLHLQDMRSMAGKLLDHVLGDKNPITTTNIKDHL